MEQSKDFNRNLSGGKRRNKGIQTYGPHKCKKLVDRLILETKRLNDYLKRVNKTR